MMTWFRMFLIQWSLWKFIQDEGKHPWERNP
jgi:hypothetical protein